MVKECNKKCSNCGHNGHNSRSCNTKKNKEICVKLFGFKISVPDKQQQQQQQQPNESFSTTSSSLIRKSKSTPNLNACNKDHHHHLDDGYLSDHGPGPKKKGVPWTEDEHLSFLNGLEKLGKGDWKGISSNYVLSRTATQVASHAQKYFKRLGLTDKRNRRFSLFDMSLNEPEIQTIPPPKPPDTTTNEEIEKLAHNFPALNVNQNGDTVEQASTFAEADAAPMAVPPILPYTRYEVPDFSQMPFIPMVGVTGNGQFCSGETSFPAGQSVPMMYIPNPAYFYLPNCPGSQSSGTFFMPPFPHGSSSPMARP